MSQSCLLVGHSGSLFRDIRKFVSAIGLLLFIAHCSASLPAACFVTSPKTSHTRKSSLSPRRSPGERVSEGESAWLRSSLCSLLHFDSVLSGCVWVIPNRVSFRHKDYVLMSLHCCWCFFFLSFLPLWRFTSELSRQWFQVMSCHGLSCNPVLPRSFRGETNLLHACTLIVLIVCYPGQSTSSFILLLRGDSVPLCCCLCTL